MFFQLFEHSDLIGSKLSLSVSGARRQDSNAGGLFVCMVFLLYVGMRDNCEVHIDRPFFVGAILRQLHTLPCSLLLVYVIFSLC